MYSSLKASVVEDRAYARRIIVLGFPYNCVSIFVRFLIISMPIKEIFLSIGSSIVKDRQGWRLLRVVRKSVAALALGILTKVSSTYLLYNVGITPSRVSLCEPPN